MFLFKNKKPKPEVAAKLVFVKMRLFRVPRAFAVFSEEASVESVGFCRSD